MNKKIITIGAAFILIGTLLTNVSAQIPPTNNHQNEENENTVCKRHKN